MLVILVYFREITVYTVHYFVSYSIDSIYLCVLVIHLTK